MDRREGCYVYPHCSSLGEPSTSEWQLLTENLPLALMLRYMLKSQAPIVLTDSEERIVHVNVSWVKLTGYSAAESEGKTLSSLFDKATDSKSLKSYNKLIQESKKSKINKSQSLHPKRRGQMNKLNQNSRVLDKYDIYDDVSPCSEISPCESISDSMGSLRDESTGSSVDVTTEPSPNVSGDESESVSSDCFDMTARIVMARYSTRKHIRSLIDESYIYKKSNPWGASSKQGVISGEKKLSLSVSPVQIMDTHMAFLFKNYEGDIEVDIEISKIKDLKIKNSNLKNTSHIALESLESLENFEYLDSNDDNPKRKRSRHDFFEGVDFPTV